MDDICVFILVFSSFRYGGKKKRKGNKKKRIVSLIYFISFSHLGPAIS